MSMFPYLRLAWLNLFLQRRRNALLGSAVAGVTFLLLLMLSFAGGVTQSLTDAALTISSGHVNIGGFFKVRSDRGQAVVQNESALRQIATDNIKDLDYMVRRSRGWGRVISPSSSLNTGLVGVDPDDLGSMKALRIQTPSPNLAALASGSGAILFLAQAERLQVGVGDTITFITEGNGSESNTVDLTVVALASDLGFLSNFSIIVGRNTVQSLYRYKDNTTGALHLYLKDPAKAPEVATTLRQKLAAAGYTLLEPDPMPFFMKFRRVVAEEWTGQRLDITVWEEEVSFLFWIVSSLNGLSVFLTAVLGFIIAVGIANTTWMSVRERTREMGTLRAIGMQKGQVLAVFLCEATLLGALSSTVGAAFGVGVVWALDAASLPITNVNLKAFLMSDSFRFALEGTQVAATILVISLLTGCAACLPAWRASRMNPVNALGHAS